MHSDFVFVGTVRDHIIAGAGFRRKVPPMSLYSVQGMMNITELSKDDCL